MREEDILITEDESGRRSLRVRAVRCRGALFRFTAEDGAYTVHAGESLRIAREGELSYTLELDPRGETFAELATPYGTLPVRVCTHRLRYGEEGYFEAEYTLYLAGQPSRRKIAVRPHGRGRGGAAGAQAEKTSPAQAETTFPAQAEKTEERAPAGAEKEGK